MRSALPGGGREGGRPDYLPVFVCAALAAGLAAQLVIPYGQPLADASPVAPSRPRPVVAPIVPEYAAILQAPIFSPDRKPGEDADAIPGVGPLSGLMVIGVATGRNFATALVKAPDGSLRTMHPGDTVQDWRLVSIEKTQLTFARDTARHSIPVGASAAPASANDNGNEE